MRIARTRRLLPMSAVVTLAALTTGCAPAAPPDNPPLIIFAAASLQGTFDDMAAAFTAAHPDYEIAPINYNGSSALATQILDGADVDVIALAGEQSLAQLTQADKSAPGQVFATNTLQVAVAPGNPKHIRDLRDLAADTVTTVLCAPEVPCGAASQTLLANAGVRVSAASQETNVAAVLNRVANGEADAGLVYATDVLAAKGRVDGIVPTGAETVVSRYPLAVAVKPGSPKAASAFVEFVLSDVGQRILREHGFGSR